MPFPRSRARTSTLLTALLIIITIFLFVISASRPTSASRVFPGIISDKATVRAETQPPSTGRTMKKTRDALLQKYFSGNSSRASGPSGSAVTGRGLARGGFGENKRKVPSCPDPLHN
ncbi:hypothetical protein SAY87_025101 [Trapa incisa]|uniref:Uncharacterized protein n=1 Tax=Trapa incisa TaxID=236973 RepID=A0AAN7GKY1_9MYRT|nr:hypothetical protein SAY87_025101 [Trapa incisa]